MIQTVKIGNAKVIISRFVLILVTEERPVTTAAAGKLCLDDGTSEGEKNNSTYCYMRY